MTFLQPDGLVSGRGEASSPALLGAFGLCQKGSLAEGAPKNRDEPINTPRTLPACHGILSVDWGEILQFASLPRPGQRMEVG